MRVCRNWIAIATLMSENDGNPSRHILKQASGFQVYNDVLASIMGFALLTTRFPYFCSKHVSRFLGFQVSVFSELCQSQPSTWHFRKHPAWHLEDFWKAMGPWNLRGPSPLRAQLEDQQDPHAGSEPRPQGTQGTPRQKMQIRYLRLHWIWIMSYLTSPHAAKWMHES